VQRRYLITVVGLVLLVLVGGFVLASNLTVSVGKATFSAGERDLNKLDINAPYGWYCIDYEKTQTSADSPELHVGGKGISDCSLFGANTRLSTDYPDSGTTTIPLDQPTMVYQNANKTFEIYVLITQDRSKYEALKGE